MRKIFLILFLLVSQITFAVPKTIYIIRHGDKLLQTDPGPTLSAKGQLRAIAFGLFFIKNYPVPDYIIAANPIAVESKNSSIRELQTIAPFANMLAQQQPKYGFPILHPFASSHYAALAKLILHHPKFNNKSIVICWDHTVIPQLAEKLGVNKNLPAWNKNDFDTMFILKYNRAGKLDSFEQLHHLYPVKVERVSWEEILNFK